MSGCPGWLPGHCYAILNVWLVGFYDLFALMLMSPSQQGPFLGVSDILTFDMAWIPSSM